MGVEVHLTLFGDKFKEQVGSGGACTSALAAVRRNQGRAAAGVAPSGVPHPSRLQYPELVAFQERVLALPRIAAYMQSPQRLERLTFG